MRGKAPIMWGKAPSDGRFAPPHHGRFTPEATLEQMKVYCKLKHIPFDFIDTII